MGANKITTISVYRVDAERLWALRKDRDLPPVTGPRRGRKSSDKETFAEVFSRAIDAFEALYHKNA